MAHPASTYLGEQRRRTTRVDQTSPLIIRGVDLLGQPFEERTATQTLSFHGCRYASKHHLPKNTWITLEVASGHRQKEPLCVRARVAWIQRPRTLRELFQVGVELEAGSNIWGVAFPPEDWTSNRIEGMGPVSVSAGEHSHAGATEEKSHDMAAPRHEGSLESYLEDVLAETANRSSFGGRENAAEINIDDNPLLRELRDQFESQRLKVLEEARMIAEKLVDERTIKLQSDLQSKWKDENRAAAEAFHEKWRQEFAGRQAHAQEQISAEMARTVAEQIARSHDEVRQILEMEWKRQSGTLREEMRTVTEAAAMESEQRLHENVSRQFNELRKELSSFAPVYAAAEHPAGSGAEETRKNLRESLQEEMEVARRQWNELLDSSLDNAAQRLAGRLTNGSQEILQAAEQKLAARVAELQKDSGLSAEAARAALEEVKGALGREVARAKTSLGEIEEAAAHFSEYSRQLDAASQDSLNELRQRLESSVVLQAAELDRRATELQKQSMERVGLQLEEMRRNTAAQTAEEVHARVASVLERVADTTRQLSACEQQAGETLHIHRERLRQVSEQAQREATEHVSAILGRLRGNFETARQDASMKWAAELDASSMRALEQASLAVAKSCESQMEAGTSQFDFRIQESVNHARTNMEELAADMTKKFLAQIEEIETVQMGASRKLLEAAAQERLRLAKNQYETAAESAATSFEQMIRAAAKETAQQAAAENRAKAEHESARLGEAAEKILHGLQADAQSEFERFQKILGVRIEQGQAQSRESLTAQMSATLDAFRRQGEAQLAEWSAKQEEIGTEALEQHEERLRLAGGSWLDSTVHELDSLNQKRMDSLIRGAEDAMRRACVDVFEGLAQEMKGKFADDSSESGASARPLASEENNPERRASA